jgi:hypothetical protein
MAITTNNFNQRKRSASLLRCNDNFNSKDGNLNPYSRKFHAFCVKITQ